MSQELAQIAHDYSREGMTYAQVADRFNRDRVLWEDQPRHWARGSIEALVRHGDPDHVSQLEKPASRRTDATTAATGPVSSTAAKDYTLATMLYWTLLVLGVLALIGGIILGMELGQTGEDVLDDAEYDTGVVWTWITVGVVQLVLYWSLAAGLDMLRDIARQRAET